MKTVRELPVIVAPVAGLIAVALVLAPVEYWRARRRLRRWARLRGWRYSSHGRAWQDLATRLVPDDVAVRVGAVVSGPFEGQQVTAFQITVPAGDGICRGRPARYTAVAVRAPQAGRQLTVVTGPRAAEPATTAVYDGWVVTWVPTRTPAQTVQELLPAAVRAARNLLHPAVAIAVA